mmetsp:Transcript_19676/g.27019  ORF Transcript_19676/g.27019 Transcript_19676/m.27019 type:complete len:215 (-) Transcript_19676:3598-4242(-)
MGRKATPLTLSVLMLLDRSEGSRLPWRGWASSALVSLSSNVSNMSCSDGSTARRIDSKMLSPSASSSGTNSNASQNGCERKLNGTVLKNSIDDDNPYTKVKNTKPRKEMVQRNQKMAVGVVAIDTTLYCMATTATVYSVKPSANTPSPLPEVCWFSPTPYMSNWKSPSAPLDTEVGPLMKRIVTTNRINPCAKAKRHHLAMFLMLSILPSRPVE